MQAVRRPAVAGTFYPASRAELESEVKRLLAAAKPGRPPKALIAPHAGYVFSGPIAASAFRCVQDTNVTRVVLLGPSHYAWVDGLVLPEAQSFATPLGEVPIEQLALPKDGDAHRREHSLEVEVPFLQVALAHPFSLVPLAVGRADAREVAELLDALWGGPETLIVISSDLSHYLPCEDARRVDAETAERIAALRQVDPEQACGAAPVNGLIEAAADRGLRCEVLDLRNSGDTEGDRFRVVGYGAFAFYQEPRS